MVYLVFAHPYPDRSRVNRRLLDAVSNQAGVEVRSLYDEYPDFDVDVAAEQEALARARAIVWQHPMYWYSVPGLLKHWFDKVLLRGWAYGEGGTALRGKRCLWVTTTGGDDDAFSSDGMHGRPFLSYTHVIEQTALFCGMRWEEPIVVHGSHRVDEAELADVSRRYAQRLRSLTHDEAAA